MPELSPENLQLFLVFVVPGFVALKTFDLFVPSERRDLSATLVEIVAFSMLNLGLWFWLVAWLSDSGIADRSRSLWIAAWVFVLVVSPGILALGIYRARVSRWARQWLQHPMPSAWDFFFTKRKPCWILFHLKNGERFGGYFGPESFASSFPGSPDVYVQDVWRVDERGRFTERVEGNFGMVIRYEDCHFTELFNAEE